MKIMNYRYVVIAVIAGVSLWTSSCNQHGGKLDSIAVSPVNQSMANGSSQIFTATATFTDGTALYWSQVVSWSTSDPTVVTVSNATGYNGTVTAVGAGTAVITALDAANNISGTATVTVCDPISFSISPKYPGIALGATTQFAATAGFPDGTTQNIAPVASWSSSDANVAVVGAGLATAETTTGTVTVTAAFITSTGFVFSDSTLLTVTDSALSSISVTPSAPTVLAGSTKQLAATGKYSDNSLRDLTASVTWSSSSTDVATVDGNGLVTAIAAGTTTISVTDPVTSTAGSATITVTTN